MSSGVVMRYGVVDVGVNVSAIHRKVQKCKLCVARLELKYP